MSDLRWIPVTKQLPDYDISVLVRIRIPRNPRHPYHTTTAFRHSPFWYTSHDPDHPFDHTIVWGEVTHWMVIPEFEEVGCDKESA